MTISVVVTGASGFIGRSLVKKLNLINGIDVIPVSRTAIDNSYVVVDDYRNTPVGDVLIHLAENSDRYLVNNGEEVCIIESEEIMEEMIAKGFGKIIYCSSAVVYGDVGDISFTEDSPVYLTDKYTRLKLSNEQRVLDVGGIVARLANIIGPGMAKNNVLSDIILQLNENGVVNVRNDRPVRDFIWIDDVVDALEILTSEGRTGIYNIGTGVGVTIRQMAEMALHIVGKNNGLVKSLTISPSLSYNVVNVDKMKNLYGWLPKISLEQSMKIMMKEI
jgi:UDP-glucose 4-epimerase